MHLGIHNQAGIWWIRWLKPQLSDYVTSCGEMKYDRGVQHFALCIGCCGGENSAIFMYSMFICVMCTHVGRPTIKSAFLDLIHTVVCQIPYCYNDFVSVPFLVLFNLTCMYNVSTMNLRKVETFLFVPQIHTSQRCYCNIAKAVCSLTQGLI